ncbi:MAG: response regulator transcription factor [Salinivirgaceae bacterium]|nr:response regulator transcription factor [Salinivirgaceae bacterium]
MSLPDKKVKIIIVDDHEFFRHGVIIALQGIDFLSVVGQAGNGKELIEKIKETQVDIILTDIKMPVMDGIEATKKIKSLYPDIKIIALSLHGEEEYLEKMIEAGVHGFILKNTNKDGLERALSFVKEGKQYFSEEFLPFFTKKFQSGYSSQIKVRLTKRELEILQEIANGYTSQEIADRLNISIKTVINHRTNLLSKTGAKNTATLLGYAFKNQLIQY